MAYQFRRVTGNPASRAGIANAGLQSKIAMLPNTLAAKQQRDLIARDTAFQNKQIKMQKDTLAQQKREQEAGMGLEAAKLGLTVGMSDWGGKTIGDAMDAGSGAIDAVKSLWSKNENSTAGTGKSLMPESVRNFNVGGALASGLAGYGVNRLVGGGTKGKILGAGTGALMGLLSAKPGHGLGGMISGLLSGGIGGLF